MEGGEKKGTLKKGREQLCSWLHLAPSVISIYCECKQTDEKEENMDRLEEGKKLEKEEEVGNGRRAKISWHAV